MYWAIRAHSAASRAADVVGGHMAEEVGGKRLRIALAGGTGLAGNLAQNRL